MVIIGRHDIQHNDIQHNEAQHNDSQQNKHDIQHNNKRRRHLMVMPSVIVQNVFYTDCYIEIYYAECR